MIEYIESNAANFDGYRLADLVEHFPVDRFKTYRIVRPGQLQELDKRGPVVTNDYLAVLLNRLSVVESLLVGAAASGFQAPL